MYTLRHTQPFQNSSPYSEKFQVKIDRRSAPKTFNFEENPSSVGFISEKENDEGIENQYAAQDEEKEERTEFYERPYGLAKSAPKMGFSAVKYQVCDQSFEETLKSCKKKISKINEVKENFRRKDFQAYATPEELEYYRQQGPHSVTKAIDPLTPEERAQRREQIKNRMCFVPLQNRPLKLKTPQKQKHQE